LASPRRDATGSGCCTTEAIAASPDSGVNTLTGEGLAEALAAAQVVVDVSNSPSFEDAAALEFFETSTRNLLVTPGRADWARDWGPTRTRCSARSGSVAVMNTTENVRPPLTGQPTRVEVSAELIEVTGGGLRIAEVGVVIFLGLLVCPPLLILAVVVAVPVIAISAVVAAVVAAIAVPTGLVRRVRAPHPAPGSALFLHRLRP
jgi:hypothetical protein